MDKYNLLVVHVREGEASASVTRPNSSVEVCTTLVVFIVNKCLCMRARVENATTYSWIERPCYYS